MFTETKKFELIYLRENLNIYPAVYLKLPGTDQDLATSWEITGKNDEHKILVINKDNLVIIEIINHEKNDYVR